MKGCEACEAWEMQAQKESASGLERYQQRQVALTKATCPICDRSFIATERTAQLIKVVGADWYASAREAHQSARTTG